MELLPRTQASQIDRGRTSGGILRSTFMQMLTYLSLGVAAPSFVWSLIRGLPLDQGAAFTTLIASATASLLVCYTLDRLRQYARARLLSYVLPVNLLFFGGAFAVLAVLRLPYTSTLLAPVTICTLAVSYVVIALTRVAARTQYVIPGGRVSELPQTDMFIELASRDQLRALIDNDRHDCSVVADLHHEHEFEWEKLISQAALKGIPVYHYRQILEQFTGQVRITHLSENDLGSLIPNLPYMAVKRVTDIASVIILSPMLVPLMLAIFVVVKLDSRGPALFFQERMGFRGETFRMVKFRTMKVRDVEESADAKRRDAMTQDDDDRITRVGRFLRKSRLDELPQAWNILQGYMSWIGPRPEAASLSDWYESEIPFYSYRHIVRPGITGWAQVNQGHVTDLDAVTNKLRFDFYYVKNVSVWLDALIALKTMRVVIFGSGAK